MNKNIVVIFAQELSAAEKKHFSHLPKGTTIVGPQKLQHEFDAQGFEWVDLAPLLQAGSIYEASALLEELSVFTLPNGTRVTKAAVYKEYELWWIHYTSLFLNFCLPYTQYKKLFGYLAGFEHVYMYKPSHKALTSLFLQSHGKKLTILGEKSFAWARIPFGVVLQTVLTILSLPILVLKRKKILFFTGDKFAAKKDYDARMGFIYEEMRGRNASFVEFVRSLESWKTVLGHFIERKRPVVYSVPILMLGHVISTLTLAQYRRSRAVDAFMPKYEGDSETYFKFLLATYYVKHADGDIWSIRITRCILTMLGIRSGFFTAAMERNLPLVIACKLQGVPTVGILHGVSSRHYNMYDFLATYDGSKTLSVDTYGVWSEWWKSYYLENNKAYHEEQLVVSGPMRPITRQEGVVSKSRAVGSPKKVLFVSEQLAVPEEVLPYLKALIDSPGIDVYMTFRPYRDGFELWLRQHHPDVLDKIGEDHIVRSGIKDAITLCDMIVGTHSTAVLEALFEHKPIAFFATSKWGDYFNLQGFHSEYTFYAHTIDELIKVVQKSHEVPESVLMSLSERFFGDPYQNGSKWVVDELIKASLRR